MPFVGLSADSGIVTFLAQPKGKQDRDDLTA